MAGPAANVCTSSPPYRLSILVVLPPSMRFGRRRSFVEAVYDLRPGIDATREISYGVKLGLKSWGESANRVPLEFNVML